MYNNFMAICRTSRIMQFLGRQSSVKLWLGILWTAVFIGLFFFSFRFIDTDLYYIIPTGNYILEHRVIPDVNPFITTTHSGIVIQNWLYCVIVAFLYQHLHTFGLYLLQVFFLVSMFLITIAFFNIKHSHNKILIGAFTMGIMWTFSYLNLRPEMITYLLILLEILGLEAYLKTSKMRYLWLLPITVLLEINLHGSYWLMHFIILLPYMVSIPWKLCKLQNNFIELHQINRIVPFIGLSIGVLFLNPYGLDGIMYVINSLSSRVFSVFHVMEQQPFEVWSIYPILMFLELLLLIYVYKKRALDSVSFFMFLGFFVLTLHTLKWIAFYAIGLAYLFRCISNKLEQTNRFNFGEIRVPFYCNIVLFVFYILALFVLPKYDADMFSLSNNNYLDLADDTNFEEFDVFCDYLDENDPDATIMTTFQFSNYFEYRGYLVFYDARPELFVPEISGMNIMSSVMKYEYGLDSYGYQMSENDEKSYSKFRMTASEYDSFVTNLNTDYFVVQSAMSLQNFYFESHPDKYEQIMATDNWFFYHKIKME